MKKDFLNKCYICENQGIFWKIEHFKPHKNGKDLDLKYDWNNLFYSCGYCNSKKSSNYNDTEENMILDCTSTKHDVEKWLVHRKSKDVKSNFKISVIENIKKIKKY